MVSGQHRCACTFVIRTGPTGPGARAPAAARPPARRRTRFYHDPAKMSEMNTMDIKEGFYLVSSAKKYIVI